MSIIKLNTGHRLPLYLENLTFHIGLPEVQKDGQVDGCMVTWLPKFLEWKANQIFLGMVLHSRVVVYA